MGYTICYVKYLGTEEKKYPYVRLSNQQEYPIPDPERVVWGTDDCVLEDIATGLLDVGDGEHYFTTLSEKIDWLKMNSTSITELSNKSATGIPQVVSELTDDPSQSIVSHDFCKPTTWYQNATEVTGKTLTLDTGTTYTSGDVNWICITRGDLSNEGNVLAGLVADGETSYVPKIYDNGVEVTTGFTINYEAGTVTFDSAPTGSVTADYRKATTADYAIKYSDTAMRYVVHTEVNFSKNVIMNDAIIFKITVEVPDGQGGTVRIPTEQKVYNNVRDLINGANGGQGVIPAFGGTSRGIEHDVLVFPFNYASMSGLDPDYKVIVTVGLESSNAFGGEFGTVTFYTKDKPLNRG